MTRRVPRQRPAVQPTTMRDCLELIGGRSVGRLVFTCQALPAVRPVYFTVEDGVIVISTQGQGGLADCVAGSVVAFAADQLDPDGGGGWSVTVTGRAAVGRRSAPDDVVVLVSPQLFRVLHIDPVGQPVRPSGG